MKKILLTSFCLLLILNGCLGIGGSTPSSTVNVGGKIFSNMELEMNYPSEWDLIEKFGPEYPQETIVAFRSNQTTGNFTANVNISKIPLAENTSIEELGGAKLGIHENTLVNYKFITKEKFDTEVNKQKVSTYLYKFEGKEKTDSDTLQFMQTFLIKDNFGYIATAAMKTNEQEAIVKKVETMLKSFRLK